MSRSPVYDAQGVDSPPYSIPADKSPVLHHKSACINTDFARSAAFCPDGTCYLTQSDSHQSSIFALDGAYTAQHYKTFNSSSSCLVFQRWYPFATSADPAMFCFVRSARDVPISLVDGNTGKIRASYPIIDHVERFQAAHSLLFSHDASLLYASHNAAIEIFHVSTPGVGTRIPTTPNKASKLGLKGIISCMDISAEGNLLAAGSLGKSIAFYDPIAFESGKGSAVGICKVSGTAAGTGITQVKFHPTRKEYLFSTSRRSNGIHVWDLRRLSEPIQIVERPGKTNQKIEFDIDSWGRYLATGSSDGSISIFDIAEGISSTSPIQSWQASSETISSVNFHPYQPLLLCTSGHRKFEAQIDDISTSSASESGDDEEPEETTDKFVAMWRWDLAHG